MRTDTIIMHEGMKALREKLDIVLVLPTTRHE